MVWLLTQLSKFHISAALVLATIGFLAVPENAFAEDPKTCAEKCDPSDWACYGKCCNDDDPDNPNCCADLCPAGDDYLDCVAGCNANDKPSCNPGSRGIPLCTDGCRYVVTLGDCGGTPGTKYLCKLPNTCATCKCKLANASMTDCWCW
jgi:hypothetical protein